MTTQTSLDPNFCNSPHSNVLLGCYGKPDHEGQHWAWASACVDASLCTADDYYPFDQKFRWDDLLELTTAELKIILTLLQPVQQFFPELQAKIEKAVSK